jgi:hypothetical protein
MPLGFNNMGGITVANNNPQNVGSGGQGSTGAPPTSPFLPNRQQQQPQQPVTGAQLAQSPEQQPQQQPAQQPNQQQPQQPAAEALASVNIPPNPMEQTSPMQSASTGIGNIGKGFLGGFRQGLGDRAMSSRLGQALGAAQEYWDQGKGLISGIGSAIQQGASNLYNRAKAGWEERTGPEGSWTQGANRLGQQAGQWAANTADEMGETLPRLGANIRDRFNHWRNPQENPIPNATEDSQFLSELQPDQRVAIEAMRRNGLIGPNQYLADQDRYERVMNEMHDESRYPESYAAGKTPAGRPMPPRRDIKEMLRRGMTGSKIQEQLNRDIVNYYGPAPRGTQQRRQQDWTTASSKLYPETYQDADPIDIIHGLQGGVQIDPSTTLDEIDDYRNDLDNEWDEMSPEERRAMQKRDERLTPEFYQQRAQGIKRRYDARRQEREGRGADDVEVMTGGE